jgi:hypothetical protein
MTAHPTLPRSVRVLWSVGQCGHEPARKAGGSSEGGDKA